MNRRIGRLITIGLFAALPVGWTATAFAQSTTGSAVSSDTGINPLPQDDSSSLTRDQKKAGDIDQNLGNPGSSSQPGSLGVGSRSDTMGTSGSSGAAAGDKKDQSGSQMSGSSGAVPGSVDTNDIQRSSGQDDKTKDLDRPTQLKDETTSTTTKTSKKKGSSTKSTRSSSTSDQTDIVNPDKGSLPQKMDDSSSLPNDSSDITK